jgi:hypothetical protein
MKPYNSFLVLSLGILFSVVTVIGLSNNKAKQEAEAPIISKCDSLQLANNELKFEIELLQDKISRYETGLEFLKYKDIRSYRYVMNAGNLEFNDRL